jgi:hypothetical protein
LNSGSKAVNGKGLEMIVMSWITARSVLAAVGNVTSGAYQLSPHGGGTTGLGRKGTSWFEESGAEISSVLVTDADDVMGLVLVESLCNALIDYLIAVAG